MKVDHSSRILGGQFSPIQMISANVCGPVQRIGMSRNTATRVLVVLVALALIVWLALLVWALRRGTLVP